jgi:hypothetical protein
MGTYCTIKFDDTELFSVKSVLPDFYVSLFQERDRRVTYDADCEQEDVVYAARREIILERLELLGFTTKAAQLSFDRWLRDERDRLEGYTEGDNGFGADRLALLQTFSFEAWKSRLRRAIAHQYDNNHVAADELEKMMCDHQESWLIWVADERLVMRAMLDELTEVKEVILDTAGLIHGGYIDAAPGLLDRSREAAVRSRPELDPVVLIGEGVNDTKVLRNSLRHFYPGVADYFAFFDHSELSVDGGASYLVKFLRAFSAARIATRLVAVFDNDAIGVQAYEEASKLRLPDNISVFKLPDIELAGAYPTIGPQGLHVVDVNGRAASIELYLGKHNLMDERGILKPVQWSGPIGKAGGYQGTIQGKAEVAERFFTDIETADQTGIRERYPELTAIWTGIFAMVQRLNASVVIAEDEEVTDLY